LLQVIGLSRGDNPFEAEIRRRRLWACYLMQCQSADNLSFFELIADLANLSLPWSEEEFEAGVSTCSPDCLSLGRSNGTIGRSLYAEVIKALTLW
jgi:hypothetical protein